MPEYNGRNVVVIEMPLRLTAEQPVTQASPGRDGHRSELCPAGYIADGINTGSTRDLIFVSFNEVVGVEFDTRTFETQPLHRGNPANRTDNRVKRTQLAAVTDFQLQVTGSRVCNGMRPCTGCDLDTLVAHRFDHALAEHGVEILQCFVPPKH